MANDQPPRRPRVVQGEVVRAAVFQPVNDDTVHRVTNARQALSQEQKSRTRRYLIQMLIRTACFLGAVVANMSNAPGWLTWSFVAGAVVLPYVAVVMVNAGRENDPFPTETMAPVQSTRVLEVSVDEAREYRVQGDQVNSKKPDSPQSNGTSHG